MRHLQTTILLAFVTTGLALIALKPASASEPSDRNLERIARALERIAERADKCR